MLWQWVSSNGVESDLFDCSPIHDYKGGLFDTAETLALALERWIVREEFREELRKQA